MVNKSNKFKEIKHFTDLETWKVNREVVILVYKTTATFPKEEKYGLTNQMRRASVSVLSNIAEGWRRYHFGDKTKFCYQARGSNCELQNLLIIAKDLQYISLENFAKLKQKVFQGYKIINGLVKSIERQNS